jgi:uncharacterized membrane protein
MVEHPVTHQRAAQLFPVRMKKDRKYKGFHFLSLFFIIGWACANITQITKVWLGEKVLRCVFVAGVCVCVYVCFCVWGRFSSGG